MIKRWGVLILLVWAIWAVGRMHTETRVHAQSSSGTTPILVELFTSEGCSSCPPADALLEKLERLQPVAGAELIILSEHVDYWNHIGWTDPYSSSFYSERQNEYAQRFGRGSVYTPQMVVDGSSEFVGSDARSADRAIVQALKAAKIGVRLSAISIEGGNEMKAHVETEALPASLGQSEGYDIYLAIALNHAETRVSGGENSGRTLMHRGVVRSLSKIGDLRPGQTFARDVQIKLEPGADPHNLRLIAFVQQPGAGKVLGATMQAMSK
jgi:hypothetical protein